MVSRRRTQARTRAKKCESCTRHGQPHSAKICCMPEKCLKKFAKLVAILGPGLRPSFGTSFGPRFGPYKYDLKERAPKLEPKLGLKPGPKIATNSANFFRHFSGMQQIFALWGCPRLATFAFFCARPCLRSATADHLKLPYTTCKWHYTMGKYCATSGWSSTGPCLPSLTVS